MTRPSSTQLALLIEMAGGPDERHLIDRGTSIRTSWVREPGKRQVTLTSVRALVKLGLLGVDDTLVAWWLTPKGRQVAEDAKNKGTTDELA